MKLKHKKIALLLAIVLALSIVQTFAPPAQAQRLEFADLPGDHWVMPSLYALDERNIDVFRGIYEDGNYYFRPNNHLSRAEFAAILVRVFDLYCPAAVNPFEDVSEAWYTSYVASAASAGLVHGVNKEGTIFMPGAPVTRQEAMVMIARIFLSLPYFEEVNANEWKDAQARFGDVADISGWALGGVAFVAYHHIVCKR